MPIILTYIQQSISHSPKLKNSAIILVLLLFGTLSPVSVPFFETMKRYLRVYQNPFTEITSIKFQLNQPAKVSIIIYNVT